MVAEQLVVKVDANVAKGVANLKKFQGQTTKTAATSRKLGDVIAGIGTAAVIAFGVKALGALKKFTEASIMAASDAQEIQNKFSVTFDEVGSAGEAAAKQISNSFGVANSTAKELLSNTGDMLSGFGATDAQALSLSTRVQTLAIDLASFTNFAGGAKGASDALTKGLLGERESMKALGIAIQEADVKQALFESGQDQLTGTALKMARAEVTLELAYEQSANAIGDYERSMDSYANVSRRAEEATKGLREEIGKQLIPAATKAKIVWADLMEGQASGLKQINDLNTAIDKQASGALLEYNEVLLLAAKNNKQFLVSMQRLGEGGLTDFVQRVKDLGFAAFDRGRIEEANLITNRKLFEEYAKQKLIMDEANSLSDSWLAASKEKAEAEKRAEVSIQKQVNLEKELLALANEMAYDNLDYINQVLYDNLTPLEQQKQDLEEQLVSLEAMVGFWATGGGTITENVVKVAALNEAIKLTEKALNKLNEPTDTHLSKIIAESEAYNRLYGNINDLVSKQHEYTEAVEKTNNAIESSTQAYRKVSVAAQPILETMGASLADAEIGWKDIGKTAIQSIAAILRGLGEQAAIQAAVAYASLNIPGGIAYTAASAAAFIASGAVSAAAGQITTAATGANFVTSGPQLVMVGDNPGGREQVSVTPLSSPNRNGPGGSVVIQINAPVYGVADLYKKLSVVGAKLSNRGRL